MLQDAVGGETLGLVPMNSPRWVVPGEIGHLGRPERLDVRVCARQSDAQEIPAQKLSVGPLAMVYVASHCRVPWTKPGTMIRRIRLANE